MILLKGFIKKRILTGLSIEFRVKEQHTVNGVREIRRALLSGVAVVDSPAYENSIAEARRIRGVSFRFRIPYKRRLRCECCKKAGIVIFDEGAFSDVLKDEKKELLAVHGNYTGAISSRKRETLKVQDSEKGLEVSSEISNTTAGNDLVQQGKDVPLLGRPIIDFDKSETVADGDALRVKKARLRGFIIGPSDNDEGWSPIEFINDGEKRNFLTCNKRGLPFWL